MPHSSNQLIRNASYAAIGAVTLLIVGKLFAWFVTGSVVILSSLMDSIMDSFASVLNFIAIRVALAPADCDHRFGHGKAESLAGLGQAMFIAGSAIFLIFQAIDRIIHPRAPESAEVGILVMGLSMVITLILVLYQQYVVRKTASTAIQADSLHYLSDFLTNTFAALGLWLSSYHLSWADPLFAIVIAGFILWSAWQIATASTQMLMDRELPEETRQQIAQLALAVHGVLGIHGFRTRQSGRMFFIYMHLELDENLSFHDSHNITLEVTRVLATAYPNAEIFVHQDPVNPEHVSCPCVKLEPPPHDPDEYPYHALVK